MPFKRKVTSMESFRISIKFPIQISKNTSKQVKSILFRFWRGKNELCCYSSKNEENIHRSNQFSRSQAQSK